MQTEIYKTFDEEFDDHMTAVDYCLEMMGKVGELVEFRAGRIPDVRDGKTGGCLFDWQEKIGLHNGEIMDDNLCYCSTAFGLVSRKTAESIAMEEIEIETITVDDPNKEHMNINR